MNNLWGQAKCDFISLPKKCQHQCQRTLVEVSKQLNLQESVTKSFHESKYIITTWLLKYQLMVVVTNHIVGYFEGQKR